MSSLIGRYWSNRKEKAEDKNSSAALMARFNALMNERLEEVKEELREESSNLKKVRSVSTLSSHSRC